jgi:tetratricopeptide (TPR) repeat protein
MMPGKAVEIQKQGFKFINKIKDKKSIVLQEIKAYNNLVYLYLAENNQDSIRFYLAKTKHNINIIGESRVPTEEITTNYNLIGISQLSNKHYDSVEYCLKKSLKIAKARKFKSTNFTYLIWGDMKKEMNQPDSALYYYTTALKNTQELRLTKAYPFIYHRIADVYQSKGNMEKSNEFNAKIIDFQDKSIKQISNNQEEAVENLITDEKTKSKTHITQYLIWFVLLTLIISILIFYYFTGRQRLIKNKINIQNSIIAEKEEKNLSLEQKINEAFDEVIRLAKENSTEFIKRFDEVYPTVIPTLLKIDPKLQTRELTFCGYLYLNFSTKEIAQYTFVTPRAVQLRKNRLRKKLNIPSDQDIYLWMKNKAMDHN